MPRRILDFALAERIRFLRFHEKLPYNKIRLKLNLTCPDSTIWLICNKPNYYTRQDQYKKLDVTSHSRIKKYMSRYAQGTKARAEAAKELAEIYKVTTSTIYAYTRLGVER